jgi:hypothetical protein
LSHKARLSGNTDTILVKKPERQRKETRSSSSSRAAACGEWSCVGEGHRRLAPPLRAVQSGRKSDETKARETSGKLAAPSGADTDVDASVPARLVAAESLPFVYVSCLSFLLPSLAHLRSVLLPR